VQSFLGTVAPSLHGKGRESYCPWEDVSPTLVGLYIICRAEAAPKEARAVCSLWSYEG
jgi:hypothetical protein